MTGLDVIEFNMNVDDVMSKEQYEEKFENKKKDDNENDKKQENNTRTLQ